MRACSSMLMPSVGSMSPDGGPAEEAVPCPEGAVGFGAVARELTVARGGVVTWGARGRRLAPGGGGALLRGELRGLALGAGFGGATRIAPSSSSRLRWLRT